MVAVTSAVQTSEIVGTAMAVDARERRAMDFNLSIFYGMNGGGG